MEGVRWEMGWQGMAVIPKRSCEGTEVLLGLCGAVWSRPGGRNRNISKHSHCLPGSGPVSFPAVSHQGMDLGPKNPCAALGFSFCAWWCFGRWGHPGSASASSALSTPKPPQQLLGCREEFGGTLGWVLSPKSPLKAPGALGKAAQRAPELLGGGSTHWHPWALCGAGKMNEILSAPGKWVNSHPGWDLGLVLLSHTSLAPV